MGKKSNVLSDNAKKILVFLQQNSGGNFTQNDLAESLGIPKTAMTGTVTGLVRKGFAVRTEDTIEVVDGEKTKTKTVKYVKATDAGLTVDPNAELA